MNHFSSDCAVIGAGAVGLAVARRLALAGHDTLILEKNDHAGMETSARNSEVIHAGLYYPPGSLKGRLCVAGKALLYDFCARHGVAHRRIGKLIAAHLGQEQQLAAIAAMAADHGVDDLKPLSRAEVATLEPQLRADLALLSPSTGIIDSHQYMLALLGGAEAAGAVLARGAHVGRVERKAEGFRLHIRSGDESLTLDTRLLVNAAGLWAQSVAGVIEGLDGGDIPPLFLAKGNYAALTGPSPFRHLIYPVPEPGGLGVHLTIDLAGRARFGPDVEWLATGDPAAIDYTVSPDIPARFAPRIARWWPAVTAAALAPDYSGVRPKLSGPGMAAADFRIDGPELHGIPGLVNLFGIESPGLTASLAIADHVDALLA
jgi:L-2-hydroxyglutarate oxidase LhgO